MSLNVLAICNYDMLFTYCFVGMAGSTHDARILATPFEMILYFRYLQKINNYLVDLGYANRWGYLAPYRKENREGTRYHLQEFSNGELPRTSKEMFNRWMHLYIQLWVIERTFGVWKIKWRILNEFPRYDIATQRSVIFATMGLKKFIHQHNIILTTSMLKMVLYTHNTTELMNKKKVMVSELRTEKEL